MKQIIPKKYEKFLVIFIIFFLVYMAHIYYIPSLRKLYYYYKTKNYKTTSAEIVNATYKRLKYHNNIKNWLGTYYKYIPVIQYKYEINNKTYFSNNLPLMILDSQEIKQFLKEFSPKKKILIYYNPTNPSDSFIFIKREKPNILFLIFFTIIGIVLIIRVVIYFIKPDESE